MSKKPPRHCIYCDAQGNLTKEHIFGDWLKAFIPQDIKTRTTHTTSKQNFFRKIKETKEEGRLARQGKPHRANLRIVCRLCNNGWMSRLQEDAKPILLDLLNGRWPIWNHESQRIVAAWATMATMTIEFADEIGTKASTKSERLYLKEYQTPPTDYYIYVGLQNTDKDTGSFWQRSARAASSEEEAANSPVFVVPNAQATTFYYGKAFFHVVSCTERNISFNPFDFANWLGIRIIWPIGGRCDSTVNFAAEGVDRVATEFFAQLGLAREWH